MKRSYCIALDTHCLTTAATVLTPTGQLRSKQQCSTTIPELIQLIEAVPRPRLVVFEEGPLADWLLRNLAAHADEIIVCDPRRNHLIAKEGDKDDPIDSDKLAQLTQGGFLKRIHHPQTLERTIFKQHVALYHDAVRQRVRVANQVIALLRQHGVIVRHKAFANAADRPALLQRLPSSALLRENLRLLWQHYDQASTRLSRLRRRLIGEARREDVMVRWVEVPGFKWVRAATWFAYLDTPWRFPTKTKLWKYVGVGLERRGSGSGPLRLRLCRRVNRRLKNVLLGAARSAVRQGKNPFADQYRRWIAQGCSPTIACRNTARSLAATLWGMWKNGNAYHPDWVAGATAEGNGPDSCQQRR
jgi:transposase